MKQRLKFGLLFTAVAALSAHAQEKTYCDQWKDVRAPLADLPPSSYVPQSAKCDPLTVYYESKSPDRFRRARWCAFTAVGESRNGNTRLLASATMPPAQDISGDPIANLMLAMLYANGEGVTANIKVARHYACQSEDWFGTDAVAEDIKLGSRFDECSEDGGSGRIVNYACINLRQAQVDDALKRRLSATQAAMPAELRRSFAALVAAHDRFREANAAEEPNGTTGRVQSAMAHELDMDREWLDELKQIADGVAPAAKIPAASLAAADKDLNDTYKSNLQLARENPGTDTSEAQFRISARAWLAYREAWVTFGTKRWPQVAADQWRAWLTDERNREQGGS